MNLIDAYKLQIEELTNKRLELLKQIEPFQTELQKIYNEIKDIELKVSNEEVKQLTSSTESDKIAYYIKNNGSSSGGMDLYNARLKFFHDMGFYASGYFPEIEQQGLSIVLYSDRSTNELTYQSILKVLPHMKTMVGVDNTRPNSALKVFSIFESTCSEYGSYSLFYDEEKTEWIVSIISYRFRSDVYVTKSLEDVIEFISQNHPYDRTDDEEDEDSDNDW